MTDIEKSIELVSEFLVFFRLPDPPKAAIFLSDDVAIPFTGRREMVSAQAVTEFNTGCYKRVKKLIKQYDAVQKDDHCVVYSIGFFVR